MRKLHMFCIFGTMVLFATTIETKPATPQSSTMFRTRNKHITVDVKILKNPKVKYTNDMADCYGNNVTGKRCADIQDKRCGLPIVIALSKANSTQKKILEENYGFKDEVKIEKIKAIFDELDVLDEYYKIEDEYQQKLSDEIEKIQDEFSKDVMWKLANVNTYGELGDSPY